MKHTKLSALILALTLTLSGCMSEQETETGLEHIGVSELANASYENIPTVYFSGVKSGASSAPPSSAQSANDSSGSGDQSSASVPQSENQSTASSGTSSGSSSNTPKNEEKGGEIVIPKAESYAVYDIGDFKFDPDKVKRAVFGDEDITPDIHNFDDEHLPEPLYTWKSGGKTLSLNNNYRSVDIGSDGFYAMEFFLPPQDNSDGFTDMYSHLDAELDFCSRAEAVQNTVEILNKMGVSVSEKADVYALSREELQAYVDHKIADGKFYDPFSSIKGLDRKPLTSYTVNEDQEYYDIVFYAECADIPIYEQMIYFRSISTPQGTPITEPMRVEACYSRNGLVWLNISEYSGSFTKAENVPQVISPETAAKLVAEKYNNIGGVESLSFRKIELMYAITPSMADGKYDFSKLRTAPAWVCVVDYTQNISKTDQRPGMTDKTNFKGTVLIDAVTGAEII